ncbi:hypothetical protein E4U42_001620 [Claviceps africana]|uniref:Subtilisin-like serine protease n=1 Tax=Claviceps africana TaxID=83212 RepID=A0A8K0NJP0_9HYPO|nr:hypothetical protein E4U42_001620 [Claviceps africana]
MVRTSLFASLLAMSASALAGGANAKVAGSNKVLGAYTFEFLKGEDISAFEKAIAEHAETRIDFNYENFRGRSVQFYDNKLAEDKLAELAALPVVKGVHPVQRFSLPKPQVKWRAQDVSGFDEATLQRRGADGQPDTFSTHVMTQVDKLRAKGITGRGVKLALIDSGVDYLHPALGGCFGKGCLVSFGEDLVGDDYRGGNQPHPGKYPMDCYGHGTHVAGIIAAQKNSFNFTGAAPDVELGMFRVFGCHGQAADDVLMAAVHKAYESGAQIISASIGENIGWSSSLLSRTVSDIVGKGVICVFSAGNSGDHGLFYPGQPASGLGVASIASYDDYEIPTVWANSTYQIDGGPEQEFGYLQSENNEWGDVMTLPIWANSLNTSVPDDACGPLPANTPDLSNYFVLLRRGDCYAWQKINNALAKGAKYFIFYNNEKPIISPNLEHVNGTIKAAAMITAETGEILINALKAGKKPAVHMVGPSKSFKYFKTVKNVESGGAVSNFSSWGPTFEMNAKPQFGAIGGNVLSTLPRSMGYYGVYSGTSMACPQAAAIMALILQVRGHVDPQVMQDLLSASANPQLFNDGSKFSDFLAPVPQQGGGLIQADDAAYATTLLSPSSLTFNDTEHFAKHLQFTLQNTGGKPATYSIRHVPAATMYTLNKSSIYPQEFPPNVAPAAATLHFSDTSITLRGGEKRNITVSANPPEGLDAALLPLWSGYITLNGTDGASLSLPYQGLTGSLRQHQLLDQAYISNSSDPSDVPPSVPANAVFILPAPGKATSQDAVPQVTVALTFGSRLLRAEVVPVKVDPQHKLSTTEVFGVQTIGQPKEFPMTYVPRGVSGYLWDGSLASGSFAPPGVYQIAILALRIFGDEKNPADWDLIKSSAISIEYQ